jgi:hypothetical protein
MLTEGLNQPNLAWINDTHWVDHPITQIPDPPKKKRRLDDFSKPHVTGSARCSHGLSCVVDPDPDLYPDPDWIRIQ